MNITKYIKHFDILTYLHVLGIARSGGHTLISGNFRYISANFRSETGSEMLFDQSSMWTEWPPPPCGLSARPLHVGGVPAPSMWTECPPPPCGLRLRAAVRGTWSLLLLLLPVDHSKMAAVFLASQQPMLRLSIRCLCSRRKLELVLMLNATFPWSRFFLLILNVTFSILNPK